MSSSLQVNSSIQVSSSDLPTYDLQLRNILSQEYIDMPDEDRRCLTEVIDQVYRGQLNSSVQVNSLRLTAHDLQLRKVISPSFELRFWCS